jgi:aminoglycoside phosphotransferase
MRRLTIGTRDGGCRDLVLQTFVDPYFVEHAEDLLNREADALALLTGTDVPAAGPVAADATATHCEYPSLLMTRLPGRTVLASDGLEARLPLLARQLVTIHALRPADRPQEYNVRFALDSQTTNRGGRIELCEPNPTRQPARERVEIGHGTPCVSWP